MHGFRSFKSITADPGEAKRESCGSMNPLAGNAGDPMAGRGGQGAGNAALLLAEAAAVRKYVQAFPEYDLKGWGHRWCLITGSGSQPITILVQLHRPGMWWFSQPSLFYRFHCRYASRWCAVINSSDAAGVLRKRLKLA